MKRRYEVEVETQGNNDEVISANLVDVTGQEHLVYMDEDERWRGFPLADIEKWAKEGEYGNDIITAKLLRQIKEENEK